MRAARSTALTFLCVATLGTATLAVQGAPGGQGADPLPGRMPGLRLPPRMEKPAGPVKVGSWCEFSVRDLRLKTRMRLHWALVGQESSGETWWEMTFRRPRQPSLRIKLLSRGKRSSPDKLQRVILQTGNTPPLELPLQQGQRVMDVYLRRGAASGLQDLGLVRLTTPAGVFQTRHHRWKDHSGQLVEEWSSPTAAIWGMVRFRTERFEMELIGQGEGATSRIRGTPRKWHLPGL